MGDNISTSEQPPTTPAPLDDGEPSLDEPQSEPSLLEKYALIQEEIKSLLDENAGLKGSLFDKTLQLLKSKNELRKTSKSLQHASEVEQTLRNKIKELTAERDDARQGCFLGMTALADLKDSMARQIQSDETKADKNPTDAITPTPTNHEKNISSDHQPLSENSPAAAANTIELENQKEGTEKNLQTQHPQRDEESLSEKSEDYVFIDKCDINEPTTVVDPPGAPSPPIPERKVVDQTNFFYGKNKTTELEDDERANYHTVMNSMDEEIKTLVKDIAKQKSAHARELKLAKNELRWYREGYEKLEENCNVAIVSWKEGYDFVSQMLYEANNEIQSYKDLLAKCSNDCWDTMKKLNDALERELKLRKELDAVNEEREKARVDNIVSMVTPQDSDEHEENTEHNDVPATNDEIANKISTKSLDENIFPDNHEIPLPTNSSSTPEAEKLNKLIVNENVNEQEQEQENEKPLDTDDGWEMVDFSGSGTSDDDIQRESPVPLIPEDQVEEQTQIEKIDQKDKTDEPEGPRSLGEGTENPGIAVFGVPSDQTGLHKLTETESDKLFPCQKYWTNIQRTELTRALDFAENFIKIQEQQIGISKDEPKIRINQPEFSGSADKTGQQLSQQGKTDKNEQQQVKINRKLKKYKRRSPKKLNFKSDDDVNVVETCLEYVFSTGDDDQELKAIVEKILQRQCPVGTALERLRELKDFCDKTVLARLTVENLLQSCKYGEKMKSHKILDACVFLIKEKKNQISGSQQHDFIKPYQELPILMRKLNK